MAKNLKLNVKNNQLAEALKLTQLKKPLASGKKKKEEEEIVSPPPAPQIEEAPAPVQVIEPPPPPPKVETPPPPPVQVTPQPAPMAPSKELPPGTLVRAAPSPHTQQPQRYPSPRPQPPQQGHYSRPPQQYSGPGGRAPYPQGGRPPYQQGSRPPYPQAGGPRPPYVRRDMGGPPRPFVPRRPGPPPLVPPAESPKRKEGPVREIDDKGVKKNASFKEFRDVKPTKKTEGNRSFDSRDRQGLRVGGDEEIWRKRRPSHKMRPVEQEEIIRPKTLSIRIPISVKDLASEMKLKGSQLIAKLFMQGIVLTINDLLDDETTIQLLGHEFDCAITIDVSEEQRVRITDKTIKLEIKETPAADLILRPPVAAFMGHVDHGKTSLIDAIRKTNIASGEAGAITQHIGAFKCHTAAGDLAILDTPGHEAFSSMRARGADVTDIVILVIAGDEGVKTQTLEALQQAQTAGVPILVALNKCDKPNFNAENVYRQLADVNLLPEAWGGTTITVNCSAVKGTGIKELLEMIALQAEILELKANPNTRARGTVIESEMHKGMGAVATVLVQNGTLRIGDALVFAQHYARVKTMFDEHGHEVTEAPPSTPVKLTGLSGLPEAGSEFIAVRDEKEAKELAEKRTEGKKHALLQQKKSGGLESFLQEKAQSSKKKTLNLILRADVQGSLEALKSSLFKIESKKVEINVIASGVGEISESDITLAAASKATIIGFHTQIERHAESLIKQEKIEVKLHDIIYHAVDDVRGLMLSLLDKIPQENEMGTAEVKATFKASQLGTIAGCVVTDGIIKRSNQVRVMRDGKEIWKGPIASLKRVKDDVREVSKGLECGILIQNFNDTKPGDLIQAFEVTYLQQEL